MAVTTNKKQGSQVEVLFKQIDDLNEQIRAKTAERDALYQQLAEATCPYKVGQTIYTSRGIGQNGLVIQDITSPRFASTTNRWAMGTFAISKAGAVTRRAVLVEENSQWGGITTTKQ